MKTRIDPELYARMIQPRPKIEVDAALAAFDEELYALRVKHGIADLTTVAGVSVETPDGVKIEIAVGHYGDARQSLACVAAAFAMLRQRQDEETLAMAGIQPKRAKKKGAPR